MHDRAERSEDRRLVNIYNAVKQFGVKPFALVYDNFQRGMTQKVGLIREGDTFKVMTDMGGAYFDVECDLKRQNTDGDNIPAVPCKSSPGPLFDTEGVENWMALEVDVQSWYGRWWTDTEQLEFAESYSCHKRDNWMTRTGKALHNGRFWIHPGSFLGWGAFDLNPDSDVDNARLSTWIIGTFNAVHGTEEEFPYAVPVKGDYTIYDLLYKSVYGDQTGMLARLLPVVDHWSPVKGGLEKLSGIGKKGNGIPPVRCN